MKKFFTKETVNNEKIKAFLNHETIFEGLANDYITKIETLIKNVESANLTNTQWFIDFEDKLNELSHKDHNKA